MKNAPTPLWQAGGTANRIFGDEIARQAGNGPKDAVQRLKEKRENIRKTEEKRANIQKKLDSGHITNKKRKQLKKAERRLANDERKRVERENPGGDETEPVIVAANLQALSI